MKTLHSFLKIVFAVAALLTFAPSPTFACAACYGRSDSPLASGMNWGIFTLLGVVVTVLLCVAGFFIFIVRRQLAFDKAVEQSQNLSEVKV